MFDTYVTIVGNVLTAPEWRRTNQSGTLVAHFKVASTARRIDKESGRWVDGNSLRVRVTCWRRLAEGVAASVMVGDPVMVAGRMYTRDWTDDDGNHRTLYEVEAVAVGHDLARGRAKFYRNRPALATSAVEDEETAARVRGEASESVSPEEAPVRPGDVPVDEDDGEHLDLAVTTADGYPLAGPDLDPPGDPFRPEPVDVPGGGHLTDPVDQAGDHAGGVTGLGFRSGQDGDQPARLDAGSDMAGPDGGERDGEIAAAPPARGRRGRARAAVPV